MAPFQKRRVHKLPLNRSSSSTTTSSSSSSTSNNKEDNSRSHSRSNSRSSKNSRMAQLAELIAKTENSNSLLSEDSSSDKDESKKSSSSSSSSNNKEDNQSNQRRSPRAKATKPNYKETKVIDSECTISDLDSDSEDDDDITITPFALRRSKRNQNNIGSSVKAAAAATNTTYGRRCFERPSMKSAAAKTPPPPPPAKKTNTKKTGGKKRKATNQQSKFMAAKKPRNEKKSQKMIEKKKPEVAEVTAIVVQASNDEKVDVQAYATERTTIATKETSTDDLYQPDENRQIYWDNEFDFQYLSNLGFPLKLVALYHSDQRTARQVFDCHGRTKISTLSELEVVRAGWYRKLFAFFGNDRLLLEKHRNYFEAVNKAYEEMKAEIKPSNPTHEISPRFRLAEDGVTRIAITENDKNLIAIAENDEKEEAKKKKGTKTRRKQRTRPINLHDYKDQSVRDKFKKCAKEMSNLQIQSTFLDKTKTDACPQSKHFMFTLRSVAALGVVSRGVFVAVRTALRFKRLKDLATKYTVAIQRNERPQGLLS